MAGTNSSNSSMRQENRIDHGISAMRNLVRAMLCEYKCQNGDACRESKTRMSALSEGHQTLADGLAESTLVMRRPCS